MVFPEEAVIYDNAAPAEASAEDSCIKVW